MNSSREVLNRVLSVLGAGLAVISFCGCAAVEPTKARLVALPSGEPSAAERLWKAASVTLPPPTMPFELNSLLFLRTNYDLDVTESGAPVLGYSLLYCAMPEGDNRIEVQSKWPHDWPSWYPVFPAFDISGPQTLSLCLPSALDPQPLYRVMKLP